MTKWKREGGNTQRHKECRETEFHSTFVMKSVLIRNSSEICYVVML